MAYDISNDRRRTRLASKLEKYGDRLQYSVFVVDASPAKLIRMKSEIEEVLDLQKDSVLLCDLGRLTELSEARFSFLGQSREITPGEAFVF
ncbi:CRISPR-associated endonuclease Cas2 [Corynebacterium pelargi]|uniref:CRISPR-associated endoribonuclease Cas2 n=1 Tax=Corynebacterium pelargi TaxID=1471400 RepID=A0A410W6I6_9CORY|nr:CRISPR-associated endonuclease Cas2 [Corynebacterium pelargi]QAU51457.1 CRISPR-associated endoribonuclease Cas2 [Corynebacterium pelargi]